MQILHISDIHFRRRYEAAQDGYAAVLYRMTNPLTLLDRCLEQAFLEHPGIGLVMITGDLCDDGKAEDYEALRAYLERNLRGAEVVVTVGNHDRKDEFRRGWLGVMPKDDGEGNLAYNVHFNGGELDVLSLDSAVFGESDGRFVQGQADWLEAELKKAGDKPSFLMTHHHLLDAHEGIRAVACPEKIAQLVKESRITAVMAGHTHHCFAGRWQDRPYYTSDGMSFYGIDGMGSVRFEEKYGYNYYETTQGVVTASEQRTFSENRELANIIFF
ncbi:MAG: metallophosphoesterase [Lachnospiraceae bacterium]|nr:metallophosphoesterase [Lachnospiraceae bacterium]